MHNHPRQAASPSPWRRITRGEVPLAYIAFLLAHSTCEDAVKFAREGVSLVCWCELCEDLRTYEVTAEEEVP